METFDHLLNWKLKAGSHRFPGPDGGTCINEAALVAAGFAYKPICIVEQMPKCFSRPICRLAMRLNDMASDEERQRLLPFVTRLACADTKKVEKAREAYIRQHTGHHYPHYAGCDFYGGVPLSSSVPLSFDRGLEALEGALAIGRQADPLGSEEVQTRMDAGRVLSGTPSRASKVKTWLLTGEKEPTA